MIGEIGVVFIDESFIDAFLFGTNGLLEFPIDLLGAALPREYWDLASGRESLRRSFDQMPDGPLSRSMVAQVFDRERCNQLSRLEWRRR